MSRGDSHLISKMDRLECLAANAVSDQKLGSDEKIAMGTRINTPSGVPYENNKPR